MVSYARVSLERNVTENLRQIARDVSSQEKRRVTITEIVRESLSLYVSNRNEGATDAAHN